MSEDKPWHAALLERILTSSPPPEVLAKHIAMLEEKWKEAAAAKGRPLTFDEQVEIRRAHYNVAPCDICDYWTKVTNEALEEVEHKRDVLNIGVKMAIARLLGLDGDAETDGDSHNHMGVALEPMLLPNGWRVIVQFDVDQETPHLLVSARDRAKMPKATVYTLATGYDDSTGHFRSVGYWPADWDRWDAWPALERSAEDPLPYYCCDDPTHDRSIVKKVPCYEMIDGDIRDVLTWSCKVPCEAKRDVELRGADEVPPATA